MAATYSVDGQSFGSIGEAEDYLAGQGYEGTYTIEDNRQGGIGRQTGVSMGEGAGLLGVAGDGGGGGLFGGGRGFTSFGDMFDGGGPGRSGSTFVGGPYSAGLNAMGVRPAGYTERMAAAPGPQGQRGFNGYGYTDPKTGQWVSAGRDMIDGGGPGRSGDTFQGGPFSGLLNTLGVRPAGYRQRLEDNLAPQTSLRPQMRPAGLLGGTAGTQSAVDRALSAASAGDTSAAQSFSGMPYQIGITPPPSRLMSQAYFNRLLQTGVDPQGLTPVGQPMTMDEQVLMPKYMSDVRSPAASAQSRMVAAERARYARAGAPFVVPLTTEAPGDTRSQFLSYLEDQGVPARNIDKVMSRPETQQVLMSVFARDNMLPINILQGLR